MRLGLIGHQLDQRPPEPQRLGGELVAPAPALVEDQVDDREHSREPVGQQMVGGNAERNARRPDLAFGADQPLGHRRLLDQERPGDLGVVNPPSVRSVSATWASVASAG